MDGVGGLGSLGTGTTGDSKRELELNATILVCRFTRYLVSGGFTMHVQRSWGTVGLKIVVRQHRQLPLEKADSINITSLKPTSW